MASNGIDFAGNGSEDTSSGVSSTSQPDRASRGAMGPIQMAGNGAEDVGGTIEVNAEKGEMPPKGGGVEFAGDVGNE